MPFFSENQTYKSAEIKPETAKTGLNYTIIFNSLVFSAVICALKTAYTSPGRVPQEWHQKIEEEVKKLPEEAIGNLTPDPVEDFETYTKFKKELKSKREHRFCRHCQMYKPDRARHCRRCGDCTLKMVNHCNLFNNCVGFGNYKYFMLFMIYTMLSLWFVMITYFSVFNDNLFPSPPIASIRALEGKGLEYWLINLMYIVTFLFTVVMTGYTGFLFITIKKGKTVKEVLERKDTGLRGGSLISNLKEVFGNNILFWLLPINPNYEGNGLTFGSKVVKAE
jgi:palmitoyltransferase